jgi:hypothetical protein
VTGRLACCSRWPTSCSGSRTDEPGDGATLLTKLGGWTLILDRISAWYLSWALAMNSLVPDRLPLWPYPYARTSEAKPMSIRPGPA